MHKQVVITTLGKTYQLWSTDHWAEVEMGACENNSLASNSAFDDQAKQELCLLALLWVPVAISELVYVDEFVRYTRMSNQEDPDRSTSIKLIWISQYLTVV